MSSKLYTNTGKVGSVLGLVVATVALNYAAQNSTKIVDGIISLCKNGLNEAKKVYINKTTKEYEVWSTLPNGEIYNTGMKMRK